MLVLARRYEILRAMEIDVWRHCDTRRVSGESASVAEVDEHVQKPDKVTARVYFSMEVHCLGNALCLLARPEPLTRAMLDILRLLGSGISSSQRVDQMDWPLQAVGMPAGANDADMAQAAVRSLIERLSQQHNTENVLIAHPAIVELLGDKPISVKGRDKPLRRIDIHPREISDLGSKALVWSRVQAKLDET